MKRDSEQIAADDADSIPVLPYATPDLTRPTPMGRATTLLTIVGVCMFAAGSLILDGGQLWTILSILFGPPISLAGVCVIILAKRKQRPVPTIGVAAPIIGISMTAFGLVGLL